MVVFPAQFICWKRDNTRGKSSVPRKFLMPINKSFKYPINNSKTVKIF